MSEEPFDSAAGPGVMTGLGALPESEALLGSGAPPESGTLPAGVLSPEVTADQLSPKGPPEAPPKAKERKRERKREDQDGDSAPWWVLPLDLSYLFIMVALFLAWAHLGGFKKFLPDPIGPIPLGVIWWGALGGLTISLAGIFVHSKTWDSSYNRWHIARPFVGGIVGAVSYLIFVLVIQATASTTAATTPTAHALYYLVAFIVGYREGIFRDLLKRASDVLLKPSDSSAESTPQDKPVNP
jgi:hypothetical protein